MRYQKHLFLLLLTFFSSQTFAQKVKPIDIYKSGGNVFSSNKLYGFAEDRGAYEIVLDSNRMPTDYISLIGDANNGRSMSTAALGPKGGAKSGEPLSLWYSSWDNKTDNQPWRQLVSGTTLPIEYVVKWPFAKYRDGAEMNQITGEMYLSSDTITAFGKSQKPGWGSEYAALAIWNPATGKKAWNYRLVPTGENLEGWRIATDMAIDAEGHMFVLVSSGRKTKLVKITVPRDANGDPISQD